jgi:hypothetical protein
MMPATGLLVCAIYRHYLKVSGLCGHPVYIYLAVSTANYLAFLPFVSQKGRHANFFRLAPESLPMKIDKEIWTRQNIAVVAASVCSE